MEPKAYTIMNNKKYFLKKINEEIKIMQQSTEKLEDKIKNHYIDKYSLYNEKACEQVGIYVKDIYRGDYGQPLADNGYYSNEAEIDERAKELFIEDFFENTEEFLNEEDILNIIKEV